MSVDISVSITEDVVDIIATPTVNIVNVTNSASIDPGLYDLSEFTNTSVNPFVRTSGLSAYVPTSRTLTINGVTQDLSANRTFTVSTGITIGTTAITSGTVGRVLFEGTGNVVQESANLYWDNTNGFLGIGTSTPSTRLHVVGSEYTFAATSGGINFYNTPGANSHFNFINLRQDSDYIFKQNRGGVVNTTSLVLKGLTGNLLINTTADAGFKLDVNGTARVRGNFQVGVGTEILQLYTGNYRSFIDASGTGIMNIRVLTTNVMTLSPGGVAMNLAGENIVNASSIFELISTTKGFLPPRQTQAQRTAIASPAVGLVVFQTDATEGLYIYKSTGWALLL